MNAQTGPVYLQNDLHPKNIIINQSILSGIIDFECAQYGERDFELSHFVHWTIFPPDEISSFDDLVKEVIALFQKELFVEDLPIRQTIYQLEHEINQLIWNNGSDQEEKAKRIRAWLDGIIIKNLF